MADIFEEKNLMTVSDFRRVMNLLQKLDAHQVVLLCHHNADPDALCAAYAFSTLLRSIQSSIEVEIAAVQGVSKLSKQILKTIPMKVETRARIKEADAIFLMDTSTTQQLGEWKKIVDDSGKPLLIIDHHTIHPQTRCLASLCVVDDSASSTCEIVFELFKQARIKPGRQEALALFLGMLYDTRHFILATSKTFETVSKLVKAGVDAEKAIPLLAAPIDNSERIARLKAANRLQLVRIGEWLIVISRVSTYQASAARALTMLGAHVAVVGGEKQGQLRISMRASNDFCQKTGIHLGKNVAKPLEEHVHGMGGGHDTAAGFNGEGNLENAFEICIKLLREALKL